MNSAELVCGLREHADFSDSRGYDGTAMRMRAAADKLEELENDLRTAQAHAQKLTEALEPFAADYAGRSQLAPGPDIDHWPIGGSSLTYGHLRRASEALSLTPTSALAAVRDEAGKKLAKAVCGIDMDPTALAQGADDE